MVWWMQVRRGSAGGDGWRDAGDMQVDGDDYADGGGC